MRILDRIYYWLIPILIIAIVTLGIIFVIPSYRKLIVYDDLIQTYETQISNYNQQVNSITSSVNNDKLSESVYSSKVESANAINSCSSVSIQSITAEKRNYDDSDSSIEIVTVTDINSVDSFTDIVDRIEFKLSYSDLTSALEELQDLYLSYSSIEVNCSDNTIIFVVDYPQEG